jgi:hypothetical protein
MIKKNFIKIPLAEANGEFLVTEEMLIHGLKMKVGDDLKQYISYTEIGDYSYVFPGLYTEPNGKGGFNRTSFTSEQEAILWDLMMELHASWEWVEVRPVVEEQL